MLVADRPLATRAAVPAVVGGVGLEYFDWAIFGLVTPELATSVFGSSDAGSVLKAFGVFGIGFLARPIGAAGLGWLADRVDRRKTAIWCSSMILVGSAMIGFAPSYATAGWSAAAIIIVARVLQGMAYAAELALAQALLDCLVHSDRRVATSSLINMSGQLGAGAAYLLVVTLRELLGPQDMLEFGWRVPFICATAGAVAVLAMRHLLPSMRGTSAAVAARLRSHRVAILRVALMSVGPTMLTYTWGAGVMTYAHVHYGISLETATEALLVGLFVSAGLSPLVGRVAQRIGALTIYRTGTVCLTAATVPMLLFFIDTPAAFFGATIMALGLLTVVQAVLPAALAQQVPPDMRTIGVAGPYSVAVAIFGGFAPALLVLASSPTRLLLYSGGIAIAASVSVIASLRSP